MRRKQPLILHADNGNAMLVATLETRVEELGMLRSFSKPRASNDNAYPDKSKRASETHAGGHDPHVAGVSRK